MNDPIANLGSHDRCPPRPRSGPLQEIKLPRPRCPRCCGVHLKKYRSIFDQGDGTALWWVECRNGTCLHRFRVLLE